MEAFPDLAALSDADLKALTEEKMADERDVSRRRRELQREQQKQQWLFPPRCQQTLSFFHPPRSLSLLRAVSPFEHARAGHGHRTG